MTPEEFDDLYEDDVVWNGIHRLTVAGWNGTTIELRDKDGVIWTANRTVSYKLCKTSPYCSPVQNTFGLSY
jgi:hypothetical protein